ncbi:MAG TPA: imidazole glycerol phosphate synthase subunit HisH [Rhizomicrobium sp.]|jgi:glutamine amidotransferase|nr:imidazole glycerol phosphate synthase subunit HisH [Rhizomicrobium sp.]
MPTTALIDYGSGNLASAAKALSRAANGKSDIVTTADPQAVKDAERIVLPGVGAFADCMAGLTAIPGMVEALREKVLRDGAPFLGICVGMQLLATVGLEFGRHAGLGWIAGEVVEIAPSPLKKGDPALKIPHMGWNELKKMRSHPVLEGIPDGAHAYFVHSFQLVPALPEDLIATTDYGGPLTAMVGNENIVGTQFHPEKSQATGIKLLENFLAWKP